MDKPKPDIDKINHEVLCVSETRWLRYIEMMSDVGYIEGVRIVCYITGDENCDCSEMRITLKGLEYLQENSIMRKIYNATWGVKDITPGV